MNNWGTNIPASELFFTVSAVLGGLALFIFGMNIMTGGLRQAAGTHLRRILSHATRNPVSGLVLGIFAGFLVHSSAATVMLVGFVNAGLLRLVNTIPTIMGANIGTSLSMQMISFNLDAYCFFAITLGFILNMAAPSDRVKQAGKALLGFGLLFLGMMTMKESIKPYRENLQPILAMIDGNTPQGLGRGILLAAGLTAIIQSSGATIGMCFALISGGAITELSQVYPIVLGAHIGTCATGLLGSIGTNIEARRTAGAHLVFNVLNVTLAVFAQAHFIRLVQFTSGDLIHQAANLHTAVMVTAALILLPLYRVLAFLVTGIIGFGKKPPEPSYLDEAYLHRPEKAVLAVIQELQRVARVCKDSFDLSANIILMEGSRGDLRRVKLGEDIIDEVKLAIKEYLYAITSRYLSRRQAMLIQHLNRCMIDIERIGDHIDKLCEVAEKRKQEPRALVDETSLENLFKLHQAAGVILQKVINSLDAEIPDFSSTAQDILAARDRYKELSHRVQQDFRDKIAAKQVTAVSGMYYSELVNSLDRIVRHSKSIALVETQPHFLIQRRKLERVVEEEERVALPKLVDTGAFLKKFHEEEQL